MFKLILLVMALVVGYVLFSEQEQQKVGQQKEEREVKIMQRQQEFMKESQDLGKQMQQDLDVRMQVQE